MWAQLNIHVLKKHREASSILQSTEREDLEYSHTSGSSMCNCLNTLVDTVVSLERLIII